MKKLGLVIIAIVMIFVFNSCEKENLGIFNPKKKISKIYAETNGHYLREQWTWNGEQLQQIQYFKKTVMWTTPAVINMITDFFLVLKWMTNTPTLSMTEKHLRL